MEALKHNSINNIVGTIASEFGTQGKWTTTGCKFFKQLCNNTNYVVTYCTAIKFDWAYCEIVNCPIKCAICELEGCYIPTPPPIFPRCRPIKISLSSSLWSSGITVDIVIHRHQNLKPQNHFTRFYVFLTGQLMLYVLCHENWTANEGS